MLNILFKDYNVNTLVIKEFKTEDNILNQFPIYVINLKEDKYRRNYIKKLFKTHRINYVLVIVNRFKYPTSDGLTNYKLHSSKMGCILSHIWCINNAVLNKYERFIVFEDDIIFHKQFRKCIQNVLSEDIDLLMLGALDTNINANMSKNKENSPIYYPKTTILGAHANIYKHEFAKNFLNYKLNNNKVLEFDYEYIRFMNKYKIGICNPNLVICELSTTNIEHYFSPISVTGFERYKSFFPESFTYDDYEYMLIIFIQYIHDRIKEKKCYYSLQEMVKQFSTKYNNRNNSLVSKWLLSSGYKREDVLEIIDYVKTDKY